MGLHGRSALLRLQSDERLVAMTRKGHMGAFELLVGRYESRLLAFCRHLLGSREDAEDVLQDVMAAAYNAMMADNRPINVRPWLYRIARNRSLNHLRRAQAIGVDSMDIHLSEHGTTTADKVHEREEFRLLVVDIRGLPETQRTALVLREMDALSYEQIAEAMDTTVPSVKSLLVRARISLAEASEARLLTCDEVRTELAEVAEGLLKKPNPLVRRHLKSCQRCETFQTQLKHTNKALAALLPIGPWVVLRKLAFLHLGHGAGTGAAGSSASAASGGAAGSTAAAGAGAAAAGGGIAFGGGAGGMLSAGMGALATKAAAGLAAAALVTAGAVEVDHSAHHHPHVTTSASVTPPAAVSHRPGSGVRPAPPVTAAANSAVTTKNKTAASAKTDKASVEATKAALAKTKAKPKVTPAVTTPTVTTTTPATTTTTPVPATEPGRTDTTPVATVLPPTEAGTPAAASTAAPVESTPATGTGTAASTPTTPSTGTPTSTSPTPTTTTPAPSTGTPISSTPTTTTPVPSTTTTTTPAGTTTTPTGTTTAPTTTSPPVAPVGAPPAS